jgi:hypothetical protein
VLRADKILNPIVAVACLDVQTLNNTGILDSIAAVMRDKGSTYRLIFACQSDCTGIYQRIIAGAQKNAVVDAPGICKHIIAAKCCDGAGYHA